MNGEKIFFLSWKGRESGPFSAKEIKDMLGCGKIGMLHLVRTKSTAWKPLKNVDLSKMTDESAPAAPRSGEKIDALALTVYAVAGLTFLSPWLLSASFALSAYQWMAGFKRSAVLSFIVALAIAAGGMVFFGLVYPTILE